MIRFVTASIRRPLWCLVAVVLLVLVPEARAQTTYNLGFTTGTSGTTVLWTTTTTWSPTGTPGAGDAIAISQDLLGSSTIAYATGVTGTVSIATISVTDTSPGTNSGAFVLFNAGVAGSALQFSTTSPSVSTNIVNVNSLANQVTVQNPLFQANSTFTKGANGNVRLTFLTAESGSSFSNNVTSLSGTGGALWLANFSGGTMALPTINFDGTGSADTGLAINNAGFTATGKTIALGGAGLTLGGNGALTLQNNSTMNGGEVSMGSNNSNYFYLNGGGTLTVNDSVGSFTTLNMGNQQAGGGTAAVNVQSGTLSFSSTGVMGAPTNSANQTQTMLINVSGGLMQFTKSDSNWDFLVGSDGRTSSTGVLTLSATVTVSGTGVLDLGTRARLVLGRDSNASGSNVTGVVSLAGGTLKTAREIARGSNTGTGGTDRAQVFLNGGVLETTAAVADLFTGFTGANDGIFVSAGNAVIDTGAFAVGIAGNLLSNPSSTGGGLVKRGSGTLTLSGTGNTYTGATTIAGGTLTLGSNQALNGFLTLGGSAGASAVGAADLTAASGTFGGLTVQTLSSDTNRITIGSGRTLATNGNVTIGTSLANSSGTTSLIVAGATAGAGAWTIVNSQSNGFFIVGANSNTGTNATTFDGSALGTLSVNLSGSSSVFRVGSSSNLSTVLTPATATLAVSSTITAKTIGVGDVSGESVTHTLFLGSGEQRLNTDSLVVANGSTTNFGRASGRILFAGPTGSLVLRAQNGIDRANITMVSGGATSASNPTATIDLRGHDADLLVGTLAMSTLTGNNSFYNSTFSFDQGTLDVTTLTMGSKSSTSHGTSSPTVTVNLGSSTNAAVNASTIGSIVMAAHSGTSGTINAVLNIAGANSSVSVPGAWVVASNGAATGEGTSNGTVSISAGTVTAGSGIVLRSRSGFGTVNGTLTLTGGSLTSGGDITSQGSGGSGNSTLTLNGGTLDMGGFAIGGAGQTISANFQSGTLANLGQINNGAGLTKTTTGTLTLAGTNTYGGGTTVSAGRLVGTAASLQGAITNNAAVEFDQANSGTYSGAMSGGGSLTKSGAGTLALTSLQTFTGPTLVAAGTLDLNAGSGLASSLVSVAAGAVLDASDLGGLAVASGQTLGGNGTVIGGFTIANGATLSPGASPGTLTGTAGTITWGNAGNYNWQIHTVAGGVGTGTGWDFLDSSGPLVITATAGGFDINLWSLSGVGPDVNGDAPDFNGNYDYAFLIAEFDGGITGFSPTAFTLNTAAANGTGGFSNALNGGAFSIARGDAVAGGNANQIYIVYAAVPEPGTLALAGVGLAAAVVLARRRRTRGVG